ncbi:MAG: mitochondrial fission ELM1 family protein [Bdellovibrionales bacterium]|nr:mitochondrial fission ELM1 family protein [Bdellovibrionales bacterium]
MRYLLVFPTLFCIFTGSAFAKYEVAIVNTHLSGELNSLVGIARKMETNYHIVEADQLDLVESSLDLVLHALGNENEIDELRNFKARHPFVKLVNFGDPLSNYDLFDKIIMPSHLPVLQSGIQVDYIEGIPTPLNHEDLRIEMSRWHGKLPQTQNPRIAVLIGGNAKASNFTARHGQMLALELNALRKKYHFSYLITNSRRTPESTQAAFFQYLEPRPEDFFFDVRSGSSDNPYRAMLGFADYVIVTGDSMSMIADSLSLGKPTYVFAPTGSLEERHKAFILQQAHRNRLKPLSSEIGPFHYEPLSTSGIIATRLIQMLSSSEKRGVRCQRYLSKASAYRYSE